MVRIQNVSRRDFLKTTGLTGGLVIVAKLMPGSLISSAVAQTSVQPNLFVHIDATGTVTLTCSRSEMGQGVRTGVPMILADELEADWSRVKIWQEPGDAEKYDPAGKDGQNTTPCKVRRDSGPLLEAKRSNVCTVTAQPGAVRGDSVPA